MTVIRIPKPLSVNQIFKNIPGKGRAKTTEYKNWRANLWAEVAGQFRGGKYPKFPPEVKVRIDLFLGEDDFAVTADCDNFIKGVLDAMVELKIIHDDSQRYVRSVSVEWAECSEEHFVRITPEDAPDLVDIPLVGTIS